MYIKICGRTIDTNTIQGVTIKEKEVLLDTEEDFYRLRYKDQKEIAKLQNWLRFNNLTKFELIQALDIIIITCEFFINTIDQCNKCPLKKKDGCVFTTIPLNWKE